MPIGLFKAIPPTGYSPAPVRLTWRDIPSTSSPAGLLPRADPVALADRLSASERHVLALLAAGLAPKQAAHELGVAVPTVRSHISAAKRKTGARTLEQLVGLFAEAQHGT